MDNRVIAGIVTYNPDLERLIENLSAICCQVDDVIIVDNGSSNAENVKTAIGKYTNVQFLRNKKNLGVATALWQILNYATTNSFDWVLTLDQDSVSCDNIVEEYLKYSNYENLGLMTCNISDRNFDVTKVSQRTSEVIEIKDCITSGSFMNVRAYNSTEGFDKRLFIDSVDIDMCYKLRENGYKIIRIPYDGLLHEVGKGRNVSFFGKSYIVYNHNPLRHYYMARNQRYLVKRYPKELNSFKESIREIRTWVLIMLYESKKIKKICCRIKGLQNAKQLFH